MACERPADFLSIKMSKFITKHIFSDFLFKKFLGSLGFKGNEFSGASDGERSAFLRAYVKMLIVR